MKQITLDNNKISTRNNHDGFDENLEGQDARNLVLKKIFNKGVSSLEFIRQIVQHYPEMKFLAGEVNATPEGKATDGKSIGEDLFEADKNQLIEFNRTAAGLLVLKWAMTQDYEAFTQCQKNEVKLSPEAFGRFCDLTASVIKDSEALDAMITCMVINDLGKVKDFVRALSEKNGIVEVDHDRVLGESLKSNPEDVPSFQRLGKSYRNMILSGLEMDFNMGQFVQAENIPASLGGLVGVQNEILDFYLLHALCDIAGAAGHVSQSGSLVMTEPTFVGFEVGTKSLSMLGEGKGAKEVYDAYLTERAAAWGLDVTMDEDRAVARLCCMMRVGNRNGADRIKSAYHPLQANVKEILTKELNTSGVDDGIAILLYYAPAMLVNLQAASKDSPDQNLDLGLETLARLYQEARVAIRKRDGTGVFTVDIAQVANRAKENPSSLKHAGFEVEAVSANARVVLFEKSGIRLDEFPRLDSLSQLPGKRIVCIGIGGGSDVVQAAMLGKILNEAGKECPAVISVRTEITGSQGKDGKTGEKRTVNNPKDKIASGIYTIGEKSSGSGRFLENVPASQFDVYLVVDKAGESLEKKIETVLKNVGNVDAIIAVDTGGDALYKATSENNAKATPEQDLKVLQALSRLSNIDKLSCEIAVGVDSPANDEKILKDANAMYYSLSPEETTSVLNQYSEWRMDGSDQTRFGKTPLSWQIALQGVGGYTCLNLPSRVVTDARNPWNPFVHISSSMAPIFIMGLDSHVQSIEA